MSSNGSGITKIRRVQTADGSGRGAPTGPSRAGKENREPLHPTPSGGRNATGHSGREAKEAKAEQPKEPIEATPKSDASRSKDVKPRQAMVGADPACSGNSPTKPYPKLKG